MIDLIGIGALNLDVIVGRTAGAKLSSSVSAEVAQTCEPGAERPTTRDQIDRMITLVGRHARIHLGGSAFNAVRTVAAISQRLRLGYVGSLGTLGFGLPSNDIGFDEWFKVNNVDVKFLDRIPDETPGIAISYMNHYDRQLITHPGANNNFHKLLSRYGTTLIDYLSNARLIHVTSLFDETSAPMLVEVLTAVKLSNPTIKISFDPGHYWVYHPTEAISSLYKFTDILFLNDREFKGVRGYVNGEGDTDVALRILSDLGRARQVVVKRPHEIAIFTAAENDLIDQRCPNAVISDNDIEDTTGTGDVFAGGFLAAKLLGVRKTDVCVEFALRLVRATLTLGREKAYRLYPSILSEFIGEVAPFPLRSFMIKRDG